MNLVEDSKIQGAEDSSEVVRKVDAKAPSLRVTKNVSRECGCLGFAAKALVDFPTSRYAQSVRCIGTVMPFRVVGRIWVWNGSKVDHCQASILTDCPLTVPPPSADLVIDGPHV